MGQNDESLTKSLGNIIEDYTWLILDTFLLLILLALFLNYSEFDGNMRGLLKGLLVVSLWIFALSGFHLLVYLKRKPGTELKKWKSYSFFILKFILLILFFLWATYKNYL